MPSATCSRYLPSAPVVVWRATEPSARVSATVAPATGAPSLVSVTVPATTPLGGSSKTTETPSDSEAVLYEKTVATVPVAFSIPTVAELPRSRTFAGSMPRYAVRTEPSAKTIASASIRRSCPKIFTLRHSTTNACRPPTVAVPVYTPDEASTCRSSQNG